MRVSAANAGLAKAMIERYKAEYKMSQRDLAEFCGVTQRVVCLWGAGVYVPNSEHLDRLREVPMLLAGRVVKYPRQAIDILMGRE